VQLASEPRQGSAIRPGLLRFSSALRGRLACSGPRRCPRRKC
jgi:hypothetical protein